MGRILLEGGIIILLVLIGISVFIPDGGNNINDVIVDFENSVESGDVVNDGELNDVEISEEYDVNFIAKINCRIANLIVDGLNSVFELGMNVLRHIIN
jgi:hypothetical protein